MSEQGVRPRDDAQAGWADGPLSAIDIKTTGGDDETTRILSVALKCIAWPTPVEDREFLINPGIRVPSEVTARHGITTGQLRSKGLAPAKALQQIANRLERNFQGWPLIGFDIVSTLTVLDREMRRHLGHGLAVTSPIVDAHLIDRALDHRAGPRTLEESCRYYRVRHQAGHGPAEDALAAARLAWRLARLYPAVVGRVPVAELHRRQIDWAQEQEGRADWPLRPYTLSGEMRDPAVVEAIRDKILSDWEHRLCTDGPNMFDPELHIINDTKDPEPYFTSIRTLPLKVGHRDGPLVASMGALARAMVADRVVVAWEPHTLLLAAQGPLDRPPKRTEHALRIADVVSGTVTRLSRHPFTLPVGRPYRKWFAWGDPEELDPVSEPLPRPITDLIRRWREPDRDPRIAALWHHSFTTAGFEITTTPRPRRATRFAQR